MPSELNLSDGLSRGQVCPGAYSGLTGNQHPVNVPKKTARVLSVPVIKNQMKKPSRCLSSSSTGQAPAKKVMKQPSKVVTQKGAKQTEQEVGAAAPHPRGSWSRSTSSTKQIDTRWSTSTRAT